MSGNRGNAGGLAELPEGVMEENGNEVGSARARIVIIDDQAVMRKKVRTVLEAAGYEVVAEAEDGDQAVEVVGQFKPDVVMMDYVMERMDGISAIRQLREVYPAVRVVMLTTEARPSVVSECLRAGAVNFVIKPFNDQQLLNATHGALNR